MLLERRQESIKRYVHRSYRAAGIEVRNGSEVGPRPGLYSSQMIIERQGGKVAVKSTKGEGSTFWFSLPRAEI